MQSNQSSRKRNNSNNNMLAGMLVVVFGALMLMRQLGVDFPRWLFTWPMILIGIGLFVIIKNRFRDIGGYIMIAIGILFLLDDIFPDLPIRNFGWPTIIIAVGIFMITGGKKCTGRHKRRMQEIENSNSGALDTDDQRYSMHDDSLEITSIFGGQKRLVMSKNFKGGEIVAIFGGAEVNLTQADFKDVIEIEVVQIFGGTKLLIPANWDIRSETVAILGGVEDKRQPSGLPPDKTIIISGTTIFGGIEIKSF